MNMIRHAINDQRLSVLFFDKSGEIGEKFLPKFCLYERQKSLSPENHVKNKVRMGMGHFLYAVVRWTTPIVGLY